MSRNSENEIQTLKYRISQRDSIPVAVTKSKNLINEDKEITGGLNYLTLSLLCQLTRKRIFYPVKYLTCQHAQCFELEAFLRMVHVCPQRYSLHKCPHCEKAVKFEDLRPDAFFSKILHTKDKKGMKNNQATSVKIFENGEWELPQSDKDKSILDLVDSDDDEKGNSVGTCTSKVEFKEFKGTKSSPNTAPEVITIVDDDDEGVKEGAVSNNSNTQAQPSVNSNKPYMFVRREIDMFLASRANTLGTSFAVPYIPPPRHGNKNLHPRQQTSTDTGRSAPRLPGKDSNAAKGNPKKRSSSSQEASKAPPSQETSKRIASESREEERRRIVKNLLEKSEHFSNLAKKLIHKSEPRVVKIWMTKSDRFKQMAEAELAKLNQLPGQSKQPKAAKVRDVPATQSTRVLRPRPVTRRPDSPNSQFNAPDYNQHNFAQTQVNNSFNIQHHSHNPFQNWGPVGQFPLQGGLQPFSFPQPQGFPQNPQMPTYPGWDYPGWQTPHWNGPPTNTNNPWSNFGQANNQNDNQYGNANQQNVSHFIDGFEFRRRPRPGAAIPNDTNQPESYDYGHGRNVV